MTFDLSKFSDTEILAKTAWGECRGGEETGMTSILNVIMNRAKKPCWWGKTPRGVCLQEDQFDCWNENDPNFKKLLNADDEVYAEAINLAKQALSGELADLTDGSCYYFAKTIEKWPPWARGKTPIADIAGQLFFKDIA